MNEKIRELAEQANVNPGGMRIVDIEKFAQLIVRECGGIYSKIDNGNPHLGTDNYLEALQKHFGVKE